MSKWCSLIKGTWKRNLECRNFGGSFQHLSTKNEIIKIEEIKRKTSNQNLKFLQWSFGKSTKLTDLQFGYEMKIKTNTFPLEMEWKQDDSLCRGYFYRSTNTAILHFNTRKVMANVTYTFLDENRLSVCVVEINKEKKRKKLQYGNMLKIHENKIKKN